MSYDWQSFALETILWTGALIALVLVLRRPVSRHFGARAAYALWALPFVRLLFPPLVLPAWLAENSSPASTAPMPAVPLPVTEYALAEVGGGGALMQPMVVSAPPVDWLLVGLAVWLAGTVAFLFLRFSSYFAMRRELLEGSTEVGCNGRVRLLETPAIDSPLAFGVFDKVVALPPGFMVRTEPARRDLALAHELAHHRAHDLLANALVQPLFAMHWFNPLGWVGWRAMRRDQEAACDARVVAACDEDQRATYATTIASFAIRTGHGPGLALAAPMACPVLGDKSIIHRLRSLTMSDISPRRRVAARAMMLCALAALPLTASISYAEATSAPTAPEPPAAPNAPAPLAPPAAPAAPMAPAAPSAPELPEDGSASGEGNHVFVFSQSDDENVQGGDAKRVVRVERNVVRDGKGKRTEKTSYTVNGREATAQERAEIEAALAEARKGLVEAEEAHREVRVMRERLGDYGEVRKEIEVIRRKLAEGGEIEREIQLALREARAEMPELRFECDGSEQTVREQVGADGRTVMVICQTAALASARSALGTVRQAIERDRNLSKRERAEALRSLDEAMREMESAN